MLCIGFDFGYSDSKNHSVVLKLTQQLQDSKFEPLKVSEFLIVALFLFYSLSGLNAFICKLDERNKKELGSHSDLCVSRVYGEPLDIIPPKPLPQWMVTPELQHHSESPCSQESSDPSTPVSSGTLPSAQRPTNTDSLYGPMYTPSSIDTVYGPTMLLHLIFTVICNNVYTTAGQNAEITVRANTDIIHIVYYRVCRRKNTETRSQLTVCDTGCAR